MLLLSRPPLMAAGVLASEVDMVVGLQEAGVELTVGDATGGVRARPFMFGISSTLHILVH
jgi:hypothetical protein